MGWGRPKKRGREKANPSSFDSGCTFMLQHINRHAFLSLIIPSMARSITSSLAPPLLFDDRSVVAQPISLIF